MVKGTRDEKMQDNVFIIKIKHWYVEVQTDAEGNSFSSFVQMFQGDST